MRPLGDYICPPSITFGRKNALIFGGSCPKPFADSLAPRSGERVRERGSSHPTGGSLLSPALSPASVRERGRRHAGRTLTRQPRSADSLAPRSGERVRRGRSSHCPGGSLLSPTLFPASVRERGRRRAGRLSRRIQATAHSRALKCRAWRLGAGAFVRARFAPSSGISSARKAGFSRRPARCQSRHKVCAAASGGAWRRVVKY